MDDAPTGKLPSWAVVLRMPSAAPDSWRSETDQTRDVLFAGKLLSVSAIGPDAKLIFDGAKRGVATAAMFDPAVGLKIRKKLRR